MLGSNASWLYNFLKGKIAKLLGVKFILCSKSIYGYIGTFTPHYASAPANIDNVDSGKFIKILPELFNIESTISISRSPISTSTPTRASSPGTAPGSGDPMHGYVKNVIVWVGYLIIGATLIDVLVPIKRLTSIGRARLRIVALSAVLEPLLITTLKQSSNMHCPGR